MPNLNILSWGFKYEKNNSQNWRNDVRNVRGSYKRRDKSGIPDKKGKLLTLKGRMRDK